MQIDACENCYCAFQAPMVACPDGRQGCLGAHYGKDSFVCPHCGHNCGPAVAKAMSEGSYCMTLGMGVYNPRALARLEIHTGPAQSTETAGEPITGSPTWPPAGRP